MYCKVNQLHIYIYALFFRFFSYIGHYRVLRRVPCAIEQALINYFFIYSNVYTSMPGFSQWLSGKVYACNAGPTGGAGLIPGLGRSHDGGHGNLLQYSYLENPMDRWAWWATVHGAAKSRTRLKSLSMYISITIFQFVPPPLTPW